MLGIDKIMTRQGRAVEGLTMGGRPTMNIKSEERREKTKVKSCKRSFYHNRFPGSSGPRGPYESCGPPRPPLRRRACVCAPPTALLAAFGPVGVTGDITVGACIIGPPSIRDSGAYCRTFPLPKLPGGLSDSWKRGRFVLELDEAGSRFWRDMFFSLSKPTSSIASRSDASTVPADFSTSPRGRRTPVGGGGYAELFSLYPPICGPQVSSSDDVIDTVSDPSY